MEVIQIVIIIGVIIAAIVKQVVKASEEAAEKEQSKVNIPDKYEKKEVAEVDHKKENPRPFLSYDYEPAAPQSTTEMPSRQKQKTSTTIPAAPPPNPEKPEPAPEFDIHSTEEVRRAIIWSEILNRKY